MVVVARVCVTADLLRRDPATELAWIHPNLARNLLHDLVASRHLTHGSGVRRGALDRLVPGGRELVSRVNGRLGLEDVPAPERKQIADHGSHHDGGRDQPPAPENGLADSGQAHLSLGLEIGERARLVARRLSLRAHSGPTLPAQIGRSACH